MKVKKQKEIKQRCYLETHYGVNHEKATPLELTTFVTIGTMFKGNLVCAFCLKRLSWMASAYGIEQRDMRGGTIANAAIPVNDAIELSPLKEVLKELDLINLKYQIDHFVFQIGGEPEVQRPSIQSEMERLRKVGKFN
jgi:hypothetical protein